MHDVSEVPVKLGRLVVPFLAFLIAALYVAVYWVNVPSMTPDSVEYGAIAYQLRGMPADQARLVANGYRCRNAELREGTKESRVEWLAAPSSADVVAAAEPKVREYLPKASVRVVRCAAYFTMNPVSHDPRYVHIFESRPLYPAVVALALNKWGLDRAEVAVSVVATAVAGILCFAAVALLGLGGTSALLAETVLLLGNAGFQGARPLSEGLTLLLIVSVLLGVVMVSRQWRVAGFAVQTFAMIGLLFARSFSALTLAIGLIMVAAVGLIARKMNLRDAVEAGGGVGIAGMLLALVVPTWLGWSSFGDSLQDLVTVSFKSPDVANPWPAFAQIFLQSWGQWFGTANGVGATAVAAVVVVLASLWWVGRAWSPDRHTSRVGFAGLTLAVAPVVVGVGAMLARPSWLSEAARLATPAQVSLAVAAAVLARLVGKDFLANVSGATPGRQPEGAVQVVSHARDA